MNIYRSYLDELEKSLNNLHYLIISKVNKSKEISETYKQLLLAFLGFILQKNYSAAKNIKIQHNGVDADSDKNRNLIDNFANSILFHINPYNHPTF